MRIWDLNPGYLNRQSLLGEHRELHAIVSILVYGKTGYAQHPETIRWLNHGWALMMRHGQLAGEMVLRGYQDRSPVKLKANQGNWPETFVDPPARQFRILQTKYINKAQGRIPLPKNEQELWRQHKYSVLARNPLLYNQIGKQVARNELPFDELAQILTGLLRQQPTEGGLRNALQHMWGYVSGFSAEKQVDLKNLSLKALLLEIQGRASAHHIEYLLRSTALSELMFWLWDS